MTRWYVERDDAGAVMTVARIRSESDGIYAEFWDGAGWQYSPPVMRFLHDPLAGNEVDEAGADAAIRELPLLDPTVRRSLQPRALAFLALVLVALLVAIALIRC